MIQNDLRPFRAARVSKRSSDVVRTWESTACEDSKARTNRVGVWWDIKGAAQAEPLASWRTVVRRVQEKPSKGVARSRTPLCVECHP